MYVILGATGHVGAATAGALLGAGEQVTVVTRDAGKAEGWRARGAQAAVVDVADTDALRAVFRSGRRAFLLNPPAAPSTDTEVEEHRTLDAIMRALEGSGLESVVLESTYGAQPGERCGDLNVLYDFEQALAAQPIPATVLRAAYYMSNWDALLEAAKGGALPTPFPAELKLPMVAPADLGAAAARLLQAPPRAGAIHYVEGPRRYSANDVGAAFAVAFGHAVQVRSIPRDEWEESYRQLGFSPPAAASYVKMTAVTVDSVFEPDDYERGSTTLEAYIGALVRQS